ncbi:MAG: thioesterase family protein [Spongiibacteraceae bacterium]
MYIEIILTPRFSDTDAAGHINNTAVTQWLEAGRLDFNLNHLPEVPPMMLRRIEVDYDREMTHLESALIRTGVERVGNKTVTMRQEIWQGGICRAQALAVDCYFDPATRRATEVPERFREIYRGLMFNDAGTGS